MRCSLSLLLHVEIETNISAITLYFYCLKYYVSSRQLLPSYLLVIYQLRGHDTCQSEAAGRDKTIGGLHCTNNLKVKLSSP